MVHLVQPLVSGALTFIDYSEQQWIFSQWIWFARSIQVWLNDIHAPDGRDDVDEPALPNFRDTIELYQLAEQVIIYVFIEELLLLLAKLTFLIELRVDIEDPPIFLFDYLKNPFIEYFGYYRFKLIFTLLLQKYRKKYIVKQRTYSLF